MLLVEGWCNRIVLLVGFVRFLDCFMGFVGFHDEDLQNRKGFRQGLCDGYYKGHYEGSV